MMSHIVPPFSLYISHVSGSSPPESDLPLDPGVEQRDFNSTLHLARVALWGYPNGSLSSTKSALKEEEWTRK